MNTIKMVAIDMDGTLLTDQHEITSNTLSVLQKAVAQGVYIVLATGRGITRINSYPELIALKQPIVAVNGADVYIEASSVGEKTGLTVDSVKALMTIIDRIKIPFWGFTYEGEFENRSLTKAEENTCLKIGVQTDDEQLLAEFYQLVKDLPNIELTKSAANNFEMNYINVSKAFGVQKLCDHYGITMDEVMCLGDSSNDLNLFKVAGFPVAMDNGIAELKDIAKLVASSNNDEGVAKVIEKYVLK